MLAAYSTRRTSVVLNPRGRVLGGLGAEEGEGTGAESYRGDIYGGGDTQALADADAIKAQIDLEASSKQAYEAASLAAAFAASQMANEAALAAAAIALAASRASNAASAKTMATIANTAIGILGPFGMIAGLIGRATGATEAAFNDALNGRQLSYDNNISNADQALADARGYGGGDPAVLAEINKVQVNLDAAKNAGLKAAITQLYRTYAKREPDPAGLAYWSNAFGPTVTADEVLVFQESLYINEPNLRPVSVTTQTTAQSSNNLALPIIAAVAGFLIFGA